MVDLEDTIIVYAVWQFAIALALFIIVTLFSDERFNIKVMIVDFAFCVLWPLWIFALIIVFIHEVMIAIRNRFLL